MNSLALITLTLGFAMGGPSAVAAQTTEDASTSNTNYYVSFTFALDSLSLFNSK